MYIYINVQRNRVVEDSFTTIMTASSESTFKLYSAAAPLRNVCAPRRNENVLVGNQILLKIEPAAERQSFNVFERSPPFFRLTFLPSVSPNPPLAPLPSPPFSTPFRLHHPLNALFPSNVNRSIDPEPNRPFTFSS